MNAASRDMSIGGRYRKPGSQHRFQSSVPLAEGGRLCRKGKVSKIGVFLTGDRGFESCSLATYRDLIHLIQNVMVSAWKRRAARMLSSTLTVNLALARANRNARSHSRGQNRCCRDDRGTRGYQSTPGSHAEPAR